jgi:hypothetical protein
MHVRSIALIAACLFAGTVPAPSFAQVLDDCRAQAIGKGLVGDARNKSINECMGRPAVQGASTASSSRFATCRSDARSKSLAGTAYNAALDQCMAQSGATDTSGKATYPDCRARGVSRGLAGEALGEFIDSCLGD